MQGFYSWQRPEVELIEPLLNLVLHYLYVNSHLIAELMTMGFEVEHGEDGIIKSSLEY